MTTRYNVNETPIAAEDVQGKLPDRRFRNAWKLKGKAVSVDMTKARNLAEEQIKRARDELVWPLMKATWLEDISISTQEREYFRAAPADKRLSQAKTPEALAKAVDAIIADMTKAAR